MSENEPPFVPSNEQKKITKEVLQRFNFNIDQIEAKYAKRATSGMVYSLEKDRMVFDPEFCSANDDETLCRTLRREEDTLKEVEGRAVLSAPCMDPEETSHKNLLRCMKMNKIFDQLHPRISTYGDQGQKQSDVPSTSASSSKEIMAKVYRQQENGARRNGEDPKMMCLFAWNDADDGMEPANRPGQGHTQSTSTNAQPEPYKRNNLRQVKSMCPKNETNATKKLNQSLCLPKKRGRPNNLDSKRRVTVDGVVSVTLSSTNSSIVLCEPRQNNNNNGGDKKALHQSLHLPKRAPELDALALVPATPKSLYGPTYMTRTFMKNLSREGQQPEGSKKPRVSFPNELSRTEHSPPRHQLKRQSLPANLPKSNNAGEVDAARSLLEVGRNHSVITIGSTVSAKSDRTSYWRTPIETDLQVGDIVWITSNKRPCSWPARVKSIQKRRVSVQFLPVGVDPQDSPFRAYPTKLRKFTKDDVLPKDASSALEEAFQEAISLLQGAPANASNKSNPKSTTPPTKSLTKSLARLHNKTIDASISSPSSWSNAATPGRESRRRELLDGDTTRLQTPSTLRRKGKEDSGCTPNAWLEVMTSEQAKEYLENKCLAQMLGGGKVIDMEQFGNSPQCSRDLLRFRFAPGPMKKSDEMSRLVDIVNNWIDSWLREDRPISRAFYHFAHVKQVRWVGSVALPHLYVFAISQIEQCSMDRAQQQYQTGNY